jgi:hypothetical protein
MLQATQLVNTDPAAALKAVAQAMEVGARHDPEAVFLQGMVAAHMGMPDAAYTMLESSVRDGFAAVHTLENAAPLAPMRGSPRFADIVELARRRRRVALTIFERGGGPSLLGIDAERA